VKNYLLISFYVFRDCLLNYTKEKSDLLSLENKIEKVSIAESYLSTKLCWWSFFFWSRTRASLVFPTVLWWSMSSIRCRYVGGSNGDWIMYQMQISSIVRYRWRLPSIFQLPWKFRSWDTGFASVHTLNTRRCPRKRDRYSSLSLSFSLFLSSRRIPFTRLSFLSFLYLATPIDILLWHLQNLSTISDWISISDRGEFTRSWNASRNNSTRFLPEQKSLYVSSRSIDSLLHRT